MQQQLYLLLRAALFCYVTLLVGCTQEDVQVNFTLNNHNPTARNEKPTDSNDTTQVHKLLVGDAVYLTAVVEPKKNTKRLSWDINGDGVMEPTYENKGAPRVSFQQAGFNKITLRVNDKHTVSKWIYVEAYTPPGNAPVVTFRKPAGATTSTKQSTFDVEILTQHITRKEELVLSANSLPVTDFSFDSASGLLKSKVNLEQDNNFIEIVATTAGGTANEGVTIAYQTPITSVGNRKKSEGGGGRKLLVEPEREQPFDKSSMVGLPGSKYAQGCNTLSGKTSFSVTLRPTAKVELQSFYVYADDCGGLEVTLSGQGTPKSFTRALNAGRSQVIFGDVDALLEAGREYTLTCRTIADYGTCDADTSPRLEDAKGCNLDDRTAPQLTLDQNGTLLFMT